MIHSFARKILAVLMASSAGLLGCVAQTSLPLNPLYQPVRILGIQRYCPPDPDAIAGNPNTFSAFDLALNTHNRSYFESWNDNDFDAANLWIRECARPIWGKDSLTPSRLSTLEEIHNEVLAERSKLAAYWQRVNLCRETKPYQLYIQQNSIVSFRQGKEQALAALDRERRIANVSGAIDLNEEHRQGQLIVMYDDDIQNAWVTYQRLGGTAGTADDVTAATDPCQ